MSFVQGVQVLRREMRVNIDDIEVRRLTPADAAEYREIRLAGLKKSPEAFGSTFETESLKPLSSFAERLRSSAVFGAFRGAELLGIAGFAFHEGVKEAHKGLLWGMYVRPNVRKAGVGRQLVDAVIDFARQHVEILQLRVVSDNEPARRLYARLGFVEYGLEKDSLKQDGRYYDEILMALDLKERVSDAAGSRRDGQPEAWQKRPCNAVAAVSPVGATGGRAPARDEAPETEVLQLDSRPV
jgi:RimJ/RimL family protein N-acetyltransferase